MDVGPAELLIALAIALLFGSKKLAHRARSLGQAPDEFRAAALDHDERDHDEEATSTTVASLTRCSRERSAIRPRLRSGPRRAAPPERGVFVQWATTSGEPCRLRGGRAGRVAVAASRA